MITLRDSRRLALHAATIAASLAIGQAFAAQPEGAGRGRPAGAGTDAGGAPVWLTHLISLDFPGGTIGQYVAALRESSKGAPVNVRFVGDADQLPMPRVRFDMVDLNTALDLIESESRDGKVTVDRLGGGKEAVPVYRIHYELRGPLAGPVATGVPLVMSLNELLSARPGEAGAPSVDTILTAIESAVTIDPRATKPSVKFHRESGLLIMQGEAAQLQAAAMVVDQLKDDVRRARGRADGPVKTHLFRPVLVPPKELAEAFRVLYPSVPDGPGGGVEVAVEKEGVSVTAPESQMTGAKVLASYLDRSRPRGADHEAALAALARAEVQINELRVLSDVNHRRFEELSMDRDAIKARMGELSMQLQHEQQRNEVLVETIRTLKDEAAKAKGAK